MGKKKKLQRTYYVGDSKSSLHYYKTYCDGWTAFLLGMPATSPDYLEINIEIRENSDIVAQLRREWYQGYYDARTEARLGHILGSRNKVVIVR